MFVHYKPPQEFKRKEITSFTLHPDVVERFRVWAMKTNNKMSPIIEKLILRFLEIKEKELNVKLNVTEQKTVSEADEVNLDGVSDDVND